MTFFWRILYRSYRVAAWFQYRTLRRYTLAGKAVLTGLLLAIIFGFDLENTVGYQAFMVLLFVVTLSFLGSRFFRGRFSVDRALPRFATVGEPFKYHVQVRNLTKRPQVGLTLLEDVADPRASFAEWRTLIRAENRKARSFRMTERQRHPFTIATSRETVVPPLPPGGTAEASVEVIPLRRGLLRFNGVTIARPDPLGLMRAFVKVSAPQQTLILPRRYLMPPIALPGSLEYQNGGVALASSVGRSEEFVALREYRHGDPLRHIHWRSWAKIGKPIVKEFEDEFFVRHALVLDTFSDHPCSEVFEEAVSVAASFACSILTQESLLDLLFIGAQAYCFTAGRGLAHADQMLEILAAVRPCDDRPFSTLEHLVLDHVSAVSGCVCIFVKWDDARREFVKKLESLGRPVLVLVVVPYGGKQFEAAALRTGPANFHVLELGKMEQGLARLK